MVLVVLGLVVLVLVLGLLLVLVLVSRGLAVLGWCWGRWCWGLVVPGPAHHNSTTQHHTTHTAHATLTHRSPHARAPLQAIQFHAEHGEVCPAGWKPGAHASGLRPLAQQQAPCLPAPLLRAASWQRCTGLVIAWSLPED